MYDKNKLKKEKSINIEKTIFLRLELIIKSILLKGRKPPEEIIVIDKLNESNVLILINLKTINKNKVKAEYNNKIFKDCLNISVELKEIKLVNDFFKLSSKISIKRIMEKRKYIPPIHWEDDLHKIKLSSICLIFSKIVNPVEVNPETDSKKQFKNEIL